MSICRYASAAREEARKYYNRKHKKEESKKASRKALEDEKIRIRDSSITTDVLVANTNDLLGIDTFKRIVEDFLNFDNLPNEILRIIAMYCVDDFFLELLCLYNYNMECTSCDNQDIDCNKCNIRLMLSKVKLASMPLRLYSSFNFQPIECFGVMKVIPIEENSMFSNFVQIESTTDECTLFLRDILLPMCCEMFSKSTINQLKDVEYSFHLCKNGTV